MIENPRFEDKNNFDLTAYTIEAVEDQLHRLEQGTWSLCVPRLQDQMRKLDEKHYHLFLETVIQIAGVSGMAMPNEKIHIRPGEFCITPRGIPHLERPDILARGAFFNLVFAFTGKRLTFHLTGGNDAPYSIRCGSTRHSEDFPRICQYLEDAIELYWSNSNSRKTAIRGLLIAHLSGLLDILSEKPEVGKKEHPKVRFCKQLVMANLTGRDLCVKSLADMIQCTPDYLSHLFHTEADEQLISYINRQRITHAKDLLANPALNVSEIAWAVGYSDPGYFTRVFRKITGKSPMKYRKGLAANA